MVWFLHGQAIDLVNETTPIDMEVLLDLLEVMFYIKNTAD